MADLIINSTSSKAIANVDMYMYLTAGIEL